MQASTYTEFSTAMHTAVAANAIPSNGTIEVSHRCPLTCSHCYNNLPMGDRGARALELTTDQHRRIADEIAEMGCLWLLYTGGEIFARRDFMDIYKHAKRAGLLITLFTNGVLITPQIADELMEWRPFSIEITLYGRTRETYERLTGIPGSFDKCIRGIELLLERRLPLKLKAVAVSVNRHEVLAMRKFARDLGVDLSKVHGSGPKGRILQQDVQAYVKQTISAPAAGAPAGGLGLNLPPWPKIDFARFGPVEVKPLPRIKKISGLNLARNWVMVPHVTQFDEADITDLEALRVEVNKENEKAGIKVTLLAFLMKACVAALRKFPDFNASLDGESLVYKHYFHVGFAADTPNGLVVPVVRDCDKKGVLEIAQETTALAAKAREGKLTPAEMQGGCFSISSLGGIGGTAFTPIVNAPEVAILGVSKSVRKPVWDGSQFAPRLMLPLSLSYDHRVVDGATAARFTAYLGSLLADMRRAML